MHGRVFSNEIGRTRFANFGARHSTNGVLLALVGLFVVSVCPLSRADEQVRQVQEELRKRNLFFGDIDGNTTPALVSAIKKYQVRKGFSVTGAIDNETAASLRVAVNMPIAAVRTWPDVPVLKSDAARELPPSQQQVLEASATLADQPPSPQPPAESPPPNDVFTPERVTALVESYLRAGETQDVATQIRYYQFPVEYFDHGSVDETFVARDTRNYVKRWPERKYMLTEPVTFYSAGRASEVNVEFTIAFSVRNHVHDVAGKTRNFWTVRADGDELRIASIHEQRLRE